MTTPRPAYTDFRRRLKAREHVLGTFIKTPTTHATEILGMLGFDFVVVDQEHAPFDAGTIDVMVLAARASNIAPIVRVGDPGEANILSVLDCGASGILVPHVDGVERCDVDDHQERSQRHRQRQGRLPHRSQPGSVAAHRHVDDCRADGDGDAGRKTIGSAKWEVAKCQVEWQVGNRK